MKKITNSISLFIATLLLSGSLIPVSLFAQTTQNCSNPVKIASWDGCKPIVTTLGVVSSDRYSAIVSAFFSDSGADYNTADIPSLFIEYGLNEDGTFDNASESHPENGGSETVSFKLDGLIDGKKYQYRAVLNWVGGTEYGQVKTFIAQKQVAGSGTATPAPATTTTATTTTPPANEVVIPSTAVSTTASTTASTGLFGWLSGSSTKSTTTTPVSQFKNVDEKSGLKLAIDDGETQVSDGDTVTLKVRYENNSTKSYSNGTINIYLPDQYIVESTNKGIHDKVDNMVSISLRDFPAGGFGTAIVIARASGRSGDLDQAVSQASLKVGTINLKVTDIDEYGAGKSSNSVLGASASGAGFLPGKLIGWILLLVVLAALVIIGRRYFVKKDY
jgi:hypothetical protein